MEENVKNKKLSKNMKIVGLQLVVLLVITVAIFMLYPRVDYSINNNFLHFNSINAHVIMISKSPDFNDTRYIDLREVKNVSINLEPGKYYFKPYNSFIEGNTKEVEIDSFVSLGLKEKGENDTLVNLGNVKLNVSKGKNGKLVGRVILDPEQFEEIDENANEYVGREVEE